MAVAFWQVRLRQCKACSDGGVGLWLRFYALMVWVAAYVGRGTRRWHEAAAAVARGCGGGGIRLRRRWHEAAAAVRHEAAAAVARGCGGGGTRLRRRWHDLRRRWHRSQNDAADRPLNQAAQNALPPK